MISLQPEVYAALQATGYTPTYFYPAANTSLPCISFYEADNSERQRADGNEALTNVEYTIDLWATTPETTATMALAVHTRLAALRMRRTFSHDLYEPETGIHHKTMRYRACVDTAGIIYQ